MSIKTRIQGKNGESLNVTDKGEIPVVIPQRPFIGEQISAIPFRQYFTDNGIQSGSNDMSVNGSLASPLDFYISASENYDIFIKYITVEIGDGGTPALNKFGALSALTNGVSFYWDTQEEPLYELHEGIKTNKEFIRIASDTGAIGTGIDAYLADVSGGGTEKSYLPNIDMDEIYGLPYGLRLRKGTLDKLIFRINDNLTGLTTFNAIATGTRI
jgi:hypothetical protein